jgi:hypothetical protein
MSNKGIQLTLRLSPGLGQLRVAILPCGVKGDPKKKVAIYLQLTSETNKSFTGTFHGGFRLMADKVDWSKWIEKERLYRKSTPYRQLSVRI